MPVAATHVIVPNKAAPLAITSDSEPALFVSTFASVPANMLYSAGVLGHYFVFGSELTITSGRPLLASFKEAGDVVVVALKLGSNGAPYGYGITVEKLIEFVKQPPQRTDRAMSF